MKRYCIIIKGKRGVSFTSIETYARDLSTRHNVEIESVKMDGDSIREYWRLAQRRHRKKVEAEETEK